MKDWKKLGLMSLTSIALFVLGGCAQAVAESGSTEQPKPAPAQVAVADSQPSSAADADNGPGCAESALDAYAQKSATR